MNFRNCQVAAALALGLLTGPAFANPDECGPVTVDCHIHKIKFKDVEAVINCGANGTTPNTKGKVGGPHKGEIVKDGVDIKAPGMGQDGGGKVFHTPNPDDKSSVPTGVDNTKGCIGVDNEVLEKLKKCEGAPLEIIGNGDSRGSSHLPKDHPKYEAPYNDKNTYTPPSGNATGVRN